MALNIDIPATILDLAGISSPPIYQGRSLLAILDNKNSPSWRNSFFCEHRIEHEKIPKFVGVRGQRYVYANYYDQDPPYEYLHDLQNDPDQLKNLVNNPGYQDILNKMRVKCDSLESKLQK